jgi:hypothetical protein
MQLFCQARKWDNTLLLPLTFKCLSKLTFNDLKSICEVKDMMQQVDIKDPVAPIDLARAP